MTFVNFALLSGAGLIVIPIILHLIMRQRPKLLEFPALRFIQKRHDTNQRRLRLRHLLLLLLRAGAIALLALALARPSIKFSSRLGSQEAPVAAALIFDAAPHMQYRPRKEDPPGSGPGNRPMAAGPIAAGKPDRGLRFGHGAAEFRRRSRPEQAADRASWKSSPTRGRSARSSARPPPVLKTKQPAGQGNLRLYRPSRASWRADETARLQDRLHELAGVSLYLIDVGVTEPSNFGLGDLHLSQQVVAAGGSVEIQTDVSSLGIEGQRTIELDLLGARRQAAENQRADQAAEARRVADRRFPAHVAQAGHAAGPGADRGPGLAGRRRRALFQRRGPPALARAGRGPAADGGNGHLPDRGDRPGGNAEAPRGPFRLHGDRLRRTRQARTLDKFAAVCLLDPPGLEPGAWQRLTDYAAAGHGVGVFLGRHAEPIEAFNSPAAQQLLPGKVREQVPREEGNTYLAPQNYQHPILKPFAPYATRTPWSKFPVYRYWRIDDLAPDASTVIAYNDGRPALLERTIRAGQVAGHVLVMSTPFSDRVSRRDAWNVLPGAGRDRRPGRSSSWPTRSCRTWWAAASSN